MVAVGGKPKDGVVVADVFAHGGARAVGKDDVVFGEAFFESR